MLRKYVGDKAFYKYVLAITLPIMLQNGITNFVNMLDNIMVGQVGTVEMTGVAISNQLFFVFNLCLYGAVSGAGIFGAQFYGKNDTQGLQYCFRYKLILCFTLLILGITVFLTLGPTLIEMYLKGEGTAENAAASFKAAWSYLLIMLIGLVPNAVTICYSSTLRETGETLLPMKVSMVAVGVNLVFNYILIFKHFGYFGFGVNGAAIATVIARFVEAFIIIIWTHKNKARNSFIVDVYKSLFVPKKLAFRMFLKGTPLMANETFWAAGVAVVNQCYSVKGQDVIAAINISQTFWNVFSVVFFATGISISIIVGQQLGAGKFEEVKDTARRLITFSVLLSVIVGVFYIIFAQFIPEAYKTTDAVKELATDFMVISAIAMPISSFVNSSYFTLRSGGKTLITFLFDSCFMWGVTVVLAYVLSRYTSISILSLFFCCQMVDIIKCIIGYVLLKKGVWIKNIVDQDCTDKKETSTQTA